MLLDSHTEVSVPYELLVVSLGTRAAFAHVGIKCHLPFGLMDIWPGGGTSPIPCCVFCAIEGWVMAMQLLYFFPVHFGYQDLIGIQNGYPGLSFNTPLPEALITFH